jgi:hypothetical protein
MEKKIILLLLLITCSCASVEERIKEHSYTNEWHYVNGDRYQVYKTRSGKRYIIVNTKNLYKVKRKYLRLVAVFCQTTVISRFYSCLA